MGLEFPYPKGGVWSGLWKSLRRWGHLISGNTSFKVRDGWRIKFWKDRWCGYNPLNITFTSLFTCACVKEAYLGEMWNLEQGRDYRNPTFTFFSNWELELVKRLMLRLREKKLRGGRNCALGSLRMKPFLLHVIKGLVLKKNGTFSINSFIMFWNRDPLLFLGRAFGGVVCCQNCVSSFE